MRLLSITVPTHDNAGDTHRPGGWEDWLKATFGGFTRSPAQTGVWLDTAQDPPVTYVDQSWAYAVAVNPDAALDPQEVLTRAAFQFFPDQLAFFVADLGTAAIVNRPAPAAAIPATA